MTRFSAKVGLYIKNSCFLSSFSVWLLVLLFTGCSRDKQNLSSENLTKPKGRHILVIINEFDRNPDVIEDWADYKRYTWRQCEAKEISALGVRDNGVYYLKPKVVCCNIEFDTDRKNIILSSKGLDVCPVKNGLNQAK